MKAGAAPLPFLRGFKPPARGFWLFAYGALVWRPDFPYVERRKAVLEGYHRGLCVYSWVYRGTPEKPGLVFGLMRGGRTQGVAYRIRTRDARRVFQSVYAQEMLREVYRPAWLTCRLPGRRSGPVTALAFVANPLSSQFAGRLPLTETVSLIRAGIGERGPCTEYVTGLMDGLKRHGIRDRALETVLAKL